MCTLISEWSPSESALDLIRLNGIEDRQIEESLTYLKSQSSLSDISDIDGYDNWNAFFIMFCIKANKNHLK
ncbi:MAG: hypothetical protein KJN89_03980 [Gammaproteobacteria bacterium]|nr:hypothetical protein [Gammaproteobacteria bacterium]MBT8134989.1 hypothetical protein [Gammaproteobacteria bacterium]NNJ49511.1 hypothetical protein [Gammaproteobacteria bacterium]